MLNGQNGIQCFLFVPVGLQKAWATGNCFHGDSDQRPYWDNHPLKQPGYLLAHWPMTGAITYLGQTLTDLLTPNEMTRFSYITQQVKSWNSARTHDSSCYLSFQHPLERCQLDPWIYLSVVTIPGQSAGLKASKDGGGGDTPLTVEPSRKYRQRKVVKSEFPFPHSCLYILFCCRWLCAY